MGENLDAMVEMAKDGAESVATELDEEEDWNPMLFLATDEKLTIVQLPGELFNTEKGKDLLGFGIMPSLLKEEKADAFLFLSTTWHVNGNDERYLRWREENPSASLADYPDVSEKVLLIGSDGEDDLLVEGKIERRVGEHPVISEWVISHDEPLTGRMVGPLLAALADVRGEMESGET